MSDPRTVEFSSISQSGYPPGVDPAARAAPQAGAALVHHTDAGGCGVQGHRQRVADHDPSQGPLGDRGSGASTLADRGVRWRWNPHFPVNTLLPMRIATGVQRERPGEFEALQSALFRADGWSAAKFGDTAELAEGDRAADPDARGWSALGRNARTCQER